MKNIKSFIIKTAVLICVLSAFTSPASGMARRPREKAPSKPPPLTLSEAYRLSLRQSETLAIKGAELEKTWADFFKASSEALGDLNFVITDSLQQPQGGSPGGESGVGSTFTRSERRERKFVLHQPLFQGFKALGALRGAGSLRSQRSHELARAEQVLFVELAAAFYSVLRDQSETGIYRDMITLYRDRIADLTQREQIGKSRLGEISTAEARMKTHEANLARALGTLATQKRLLEFLTGIALEDRVLADEDGSRPEIPTLEACVSTAEGRPDVEAAEQARRTADQQVVIAQSGLWPTISFDSNYYEKREGFQSGIDWDLLFTIDVPLFKGGENIGEIKAALADRKKARFVYAQALRRAETEIKQAYDAWKASAEESGALKEAVLANEKNYRLQKEDYTKNLVSNLDVLQAMESMNEARLEANRSGYEEKFNYWRLRVATGSCCESV